MSRGLIYGHHNFKTHCVKKGVNMHISTSHSHTQAIWDITIMGEPKADNIVSLGVGRYKWYQSHCPAWEVGSVHKWRVISWGLPVGMLGPKRGWLWRPTSPGYGNGYVLIYIFAHFLTQCILNSWWPWTYQNSAVKRASARVVLGWVTS
jgi:hypothetical protein